MSKLNSNSYKLVKFEQTEWLATVFGDVYRPTGKGKIVEAGTKKRMLARMGSEGGHSKGFFVYFTAKPVGAVIHA